MSILNQLSTRPKGDQDDQEFGEEEEEIPDRVDSRDFEGMGGEEGESSPGGGGKALPCQGNLDVGICVEVDQDFLKHPHQHLTHPDAGQAAGSVAMAGILMIPSQQAFHSLEQQSDHLHS